MHQDIPKSMAQKVAMVLSMLLFVAIAPRVRTEGARALQRIS